ncbi:MAG: hypothetical protein CL910_12535 [Deltaproteobacteria bacterium]|jgi:hypothetical protein|nr:hypothetical protein [Deltaproteobacteria bacterium]
MSDSTVIDPRDDERAGLRFPLAAWPAVLAGLLWLSHAFGSGVLGFVLAALPGALLLGTGVPVLLVPGDLRLHHYMALGGLVGTLFGVGAMLAVGFGPGLLLVALSALSLASAGRLSAQMTPQVEEVPAGPPSWRRSAEVAGDDAILAFMDATLVVPSPDERVSIAREAEVARHLFADRGYLEKPESYHIAPPPLDEVTRRPRRIRGLDYEHLRYESGYEPAQDEPGRDRWLSYTPNRTAHAWLLEHENPSRPWLVCIHGYQMGAPLVDLEAFRAAELHHGLGLNLILPTLPLHGARKIGRLSGDGYLAGNPMDSVHAISQALFELRRLLGWIRARGGETIGVYGLSLGGYHTAALAGLEGDLACAIPGIPATDFARLVWRHAPPALIDSVEAQGLSQQKMREVMTVASPLDLTPKVPKERRYLFGGTHDQLVPADQLRDLWEHWDRPRIAWYPGAHLSFPFHASVRNLLRDAFQESGLTS